MIQCRCIETPSMLYRGVRQIKQQQRGSVGDNYRLMVVEVRLATQQSVWDIEQATLIAQLEAIKQEKESKRTTFLSQLEEAKHEKSQLQKNSKAKELLEFGNIEEMMKTTLEIQMLAEADLKTWTQQVHELQAQLQATTPAPPRMHPPSQPCFDVLSCLYFVIQRRLFSWGMMLSEKV